MNKAFAFLLMAALLPSCQRAGTPEVVAVKTLAGEGRTVEAERAFDALPEKLKRKNTGLLCDIGRSVLLRHLKSSENNLRYHATIAFYQFENPDDAPLFKEGLKDPSYKVQTTAAEALGDLGDESYKETLYDLLDNDEEEARFLGAALLLKFGDLKGLPVLFDILIQSPDPRNRRKAAAALGEWGPDDKAVGDHLKYAALKDENLFVRIDAFKAMGNRDGAKDALAGLRIIKQSSNVYVKIRALAALSALGDAEASAEILRYMDDADQTLRMEALLAAGEMEFPEAYPKLVHVMNSEDIPSRSKAVLMLADTGDVKYLADMKKVFRRIEDRVLRINFIKAMAEIAPEEDVDFMKDLVPNDDPFVEIYAARSLCLIYHRYR